MKNIHRIRFALDELLNNGRLFFWEIVFVSLSMVMLALIFFMHMQSNEIDSELNSVFPDGMDRIGIAKTYDLELVDMNEFEQSIMRMRTINMMTPITMTAIDTIPELSEIQGKHKNEYYINLHNPLEVFNANPDILNIYNLSLYSGKRITMDELSEHGNDWVGLYLGWEYRDVPIGTIFVYESTGGTIYKYEVLGILNRNSKMMELGFLDMYDMTELNPVYDLDYAVFLIQNHTLVSGTFIFECSNDYTFDISARELRQLGEEYGMHFEIGNLKEMIELGKYNANGMQRVFIRIMYVLSAAILISIICSQYVIIMHSVSDYGVLCSCGASVDDIMWVQFYKISIQFVITMTVSGVLGYFIVKGYFYYVGDDQILALKAYCKYVVPKMFLADIIVSILAWIFPVCYIKNKTIIELMNMRYSE